MYLDFDTILKGKKVVIGLKIDVINHPKFTQDVAKLFANEENDDIIEHLKARKDIIDSDVKLHFQKYGSQAIIDAFIYNK